MEYKTKQREILMQFFAENEDKAFSAEQISKSLAGVGISQSAVYRNLSSLEKDGKVRKIAKAGRREAYYQYVDLDDCKVVVLFNNVLGKVERFCTDILKSWFTNT